MFPVQGGMLTHLLVSDTSGIKCLITPGMLKFVMHFGKSVVLSGSRGWVTVQQV